MTKQWIIAKDYSVQVSYEFTIIAHITVSMQKLTNNTRSKIFGNSIFATKGITHYALIFRQDTHIYIKSVPALRTTYCTVNVKFFKICFQKRNITRIFTLKSVDLRSNPKMFRTLLKRFLVSEKIYVSPISLS